MRTIAAYLLRFGLLICMVPSVAQGMGLSRPEQTVEKIESRSGALLKFGTAWCLNSNCDLVVTNYHVVMLLGSGIKIRGVKARERYLGSSPSDENARSIMLPAGLRLRYNPMHDVALLRMKRQLARKGMHPVPLFGEKLDSGEEVVAYGYPGGKGLRSVPLRFVQELQSGMLQLEVEGSDAHLLEGGLSGGIVVDREGRAVGMLWGIRSYYAYALPIWCLADFVRLVQPEVYAELFPGRIYRPSAPRAPQIAEPWFSEEGNDGLARGTNPATAIPESYLMTGLGQVSASPQPVAAPILATSREEPPEIRRLRSKAKAMVDQMKNFIAVQTLVLEDARQRSEVVWEHEVRMLQGSMTFRELHEWDQGDSRHSLS